MSFDVRSVLVNAAVRLMQMGGIRKNTVTFISFGGGYACNPRAVSEALHAADASVEIRWILSKDKAGSVPDYVQVVPKESESAFLRALATTPVLVTNSVLPLVHKAEGQMFIQLWHGDKAFKKILYDVTSDRKSPVYESFDGYCDLAVTGSEYGERQFRSAFRYRGRILKKGTPRDDCLINPDPDRVSEIRQRLGVPSDTSILLYAPTLRRQYANSGEKQEIQEIDLAHTLTKLTEKTGKIWVCAVRAHPAMKGLTGFDPESGILDLSQYPDMADLLLVADALITDYSSCAGDFALTGRLLLLYQPDIKDYLEKDRSLYFAMADSPYLVAHNQTELDRLIENTTSEQAKEIDQAVLDFYGNYETGHAAQAVAEEILAHLRSV